MQRGKERTGGCGLDWPSNLPRNRSEVAVVICDDGSGIPDSDIDHVFDPFYSTKACGVGAGLGLPTSRRICEEYGGSLTLVSTSHRGTSFEMRLKAVDSE